MEKLYSKIVGMPVFDGESLRPLTNIKDLILDPESGRVVAFVVDMGRKLVISPIDVIEFNDVMRVSGVEAIIEAQEILRVEEVLKSGIKVAGNKVVGTSGAVMGRVLDYSVEGHFFALRKIYIGKELLGLVRWGGRVISAKNIVEIMPDKIVVKDDGEKKDSSEHLITEQATSV